METSQDGSSLAALIESHAETLARWEAISQEIRDARQVHDELEKAHESSNGAEREALAALMAYPVVTLDEARLKAAYFLNLAHARDFADDITLLFMQSLVEGARDQKNNPA